MKNLKKLSLVKKIISKLQSENCNNFINQKNFNHCNESLIENICTGLK